ncbi:MAG: GPR endopeptidase [Lachnospiraceae bacterium]|nr:GPR endopeptidase [Lachnospiraceae bacterium]
MDDERGKQLEVRTDLALEARESFPGDGGEIAGVELREWDEKQNGVKVTEVVIKNQRGAEAMGKPVGTYLTLEAPRLSEKDEDFHKEVVEELAGQIQKLMMKRGILGRSARKVCSEDETKIATRKSRPADFRPVSALVVGLGNMDATPDSLGPRVLENLQVTRHLSLEYGVEFCERNGYPVLSGITPGVMAQTGMETAEIVKGVIKETRPDMVLVVDALAARSAKRLGVTIQLSDTGIHPGSGVGNHRNSLTEESLGIPVFALGVPTVIGAAAVVHDTVGALVEVLKREHGTGEYGEYISEMAPEEQYELIREILEPEFGPMYVTPHDIDERVKLLSYTISEAIHEALFDS